MRSCPYLSVYTYTCQIYTCMGCFSFCLIIWVTITICGVLKNSIFSERAPFAARSFTLVHLINVFGNQCLFMVYELFLFLCACERFRTCTVWSVFVYVGTFDKRFWEPTFVFGVWTFCVCDSFFLCVKVCYVNVLCVWTFCVYERFVCMNVLCMWKLVLLT